MRYKSSGGILCMRQHTRFRGTEGMSCCLYFPSDVQKRQAITRAVQCGKRVAKLLSPRNFTINSTSIDTSFHEQSEYSTSAGLSVRLWCTLFKHHNRQFVRDKIIMCLCWKRCDIFLGRPQTFYDGSSRQNDKAHLFDVCPHSKQATVVINMYTARRLS